MIIFTKSQRDELLAMNKLPYVLDPIEIKGGLYFLPENVLEDEKHIEKKEFLLTLPTREVLPNEFLSDANI